MVVLDFNPSIQAAEAGASLWIGGQPGLHKEYHASQSCMGDAVSKNKEKKSLTEKVFKLEDEKPSG